MQKKMVAIALLALVLVGGIALTYTPDVQAVAPVEVDEGGGVWNEVCCGSLCTSGQDYCIGSGERTCCK